MTQCIQIPVWFLCTVIASVGVCGLVIAINDAQKSRDSWWQPIVGGMSLAFVLSMFIVAVVYYVALVIPCISVIP